MYLDTLNHTYWITYSSKSSAILTFVKTLTNLPFNPYLWHIHGRVLLQYFGNFFSPRSLNCCNAKDVLH